MGMITADVRAAPGCEYAERYGATPAEVVSVIVHGGSLFDLGDARRAGATHAEVMEALDHYGLFAYGYARRAGATHAEVMGAHATVNWSPQHMVEYGRLRRYGATHEEAVAVLVTGGRVTNAICAFIRRKTEEEGRR
jgi:pyrimidine deaminase RibD-like protein